MDKDAGDVHPQSQPPVIVTLKAQYDLLELKLNLLVILLLILAVWSRTDGGLEQVVLGGIAVLLALTTLGVKPKGWTPNAPR